MELKNIFKVNKEEFTQLEEVYFKKEDHFLAIPWAVIGIEMGKGALAYLGGKIFQSIFFPDSGQNVKIDFSELITELVQKFEKLLKEYMNTNELRKLNAELESIQQNMIHYMNNQNQEDRLTDSTNRITNIAAQLKSLNKLGFQSYSIAINMQILIIQERIKKYGEVEKPNLKEVIIRATEHIEDVRDQFFKWYHSRYTNPRRVGSPKNGIYKYNFDGREISFTVPQLKQWFINRGTPLRDGITNYDGSFSLCYGAIKRDGWNLLAQDEINPVYKDLKKIWRDIRRKIR